MTAVGYARWSAPVAFGGMVVAAAIAVACAPGPVPAGPAAPSGPTPTGVHAPLIRGEAAGRLDRDRLALIVLDGKASTAAITATGAWAIDEQGGRVALVQGVEESTGVWSNGVGCCA